MISFTTKGEWSKTFDYLKNANVKKVKNKLIKYAKEGVILLSYATPRDTGKTAYSWDYEIHYSSGTAEIIWTNSNMINVRNAEGAPAIPIALLVQLGHATGNGGYVKGVDYINPALEPVFKKMANDIYEEMRK